MPSSSTRGRQREPADRGADIAEFGQGEQDPSGGRPGQAGRVRDVGQRHHPVLAANAAITSRPRASASMKSGPVPRPAIPLPRPDPPPRGRAACGTSSHFPAASTLPPIKLVRIPVTTLRSSVRWTDTRCSRTVAGISGAPTAPAGQQLVGVRSAAVWSPLVAFTVEGHNPFHVASELNTLGVESRAGCHCATLAHRELRLEPAATCRLSFYLYNSVDDVQQAVEAVRRVVRAG